jgi:uncharacterized membrane protein
MPAMVPSVWHHLVIKVLAAILRSLEGWRHIRKKPWRTIAVLHLLLLAVVLQTSLKRVLRVGSTEAMRVVRRRRHTQGVACGAKISVAFQPEENRSLRMRVV